MRPQLDYVVVGAGLVGLATARELLLRHPGARLTVVEKESTPAQHQSGRNSGVLHAGLYYAAGSLKAELCREGRVDLLRYAESREIPHRLCGKLVVAVDDSELGRLEGLKRRGSANGLEGLRELDGEELRAVEPHVRGLRALHVPESGVIDFAAVARAYADDVRSLGGELLLATEVASVGDGVVRTYGPELHANRVVVCAGLQADRLAHREDVTIAPFRGDYFVLAPAARRLVRGLVYPVPDPAFPFLGVHFTPRIDGEVWAGPNAVPSLAREGYGRLRVDARDAAELLRDRALWRLARRYWRTGAIEVWRDVDRRAAVRAMRRYLPELELRDVAFGPCGIRAQALARDGSLVDDFLLERDGATLHVLNAPSPAATASLAIARRLADALD